MAGAKLPASSDCRDGCSQQGLSSAGNSQLKALSARLDKFNTKRKMNLERKRINAEIDKQIRKDARDAKHEYVVLLGLPESGKSTARKQMRIGLGAGYSEDDRRGFITYVYQHIFLVMQCIIRAMDLLEIPYGTRECKDKAELVKSVDRETVTAFEEPYVSVIKMLWKDTGIQECYNRSREYSLSDSTKYFLSNIDRIASPSYLPTDQDIVRVRVTITGIVEEIIYNYDQFLTDGHSGDRQNRLEQSKAMFMTVTSLCHSAHLILLLNKMDLFTEKIMYSDLADYFPEYDGPRKDAIAAREFILRIHAAAEPVIEA
ncbi:unnamed protein product [Darwinula stevensoni]|uniref:G protein alpha subunit n=1 Tax=Darwinula stevensoni TaxID=69355 RepID=A0A7R8XDP2_9CRUS|nr:unnamed protein product [Darwinula stevensoni]CAG0894983.1 unnamed protein product [Darwinula stevensoni]